MAGVGLSPNTQGDPYVYPGGGGVLRNLAGIRDGQAAAQFVDDRANARLRELRPLDPGVQRVLTVASFREVHRHLFQDAYEWAGQFRTVDIREGLGPGYFSVANRTQTLEARGREIINPLLSGRYLHRLAREEFVSALAQATVQLDQWHPFRDGNARTTQVFARQLAQSAGYDVQFRVTASEWRKASMIVQDEGDPRGFRSIIARGTSVPRAVAFEWERPESALRAFPELKGAYEVLTRYEAKVRESHLPEQGRVDAMERKREELLKALQQGQVVAEFGRNPAKERGRPGPQASRD